MPFTFVEWVQGDHGQHTSGLSGDYILDQSWAMPMATNPQVLVGRTRLKGVTVNQYGAWYFTDAWLDS